MVRSGKVRYIGCSNHPAWMVIEALSISERLKIERYISEQPPYNLLDRRIENELIPLCQRHGLALLPWSPLAGGILAGRYKHPDRDFPEGSRAERFGDFIQQRVTRRALQVALKVGKIAEERGMSAPQLALLWVKDQPGVTAPIVGPRTMEHLETALPVLEMNLKSADRVLFNKLVHPGNTVADFFNMHNWMKARTFDE